ncbi:MAG: Crp/Fnr family transcriptional regulator [Bacteroidota bacterium]
MDASAFPPAFRTLEPELQTALLELAPIVEVPAETELLREGQYVSGVPLVLDGLVKVFTQQENREFLLYYIQPSQSCIMSFAASMKGEASRIFAVAEAPTRLMMLPIEHLAGWLRSSSRFSQFFFDQYHQRYDLLLDVLHQVLFLKLDQRLWEYLQEQGRIKGTNSFQLGHKEIAADLGTAREVISRLLKKLEQEGKLQQSGGTIKILG